MTTLILSDTHLGPRFSQKKLDYLLQIVSAADEVIINGDFWDGFFWSFDDFLASRWQPLLELLSQKNVIYITGNHDPIQQVDDRALQFCQWYGEEYRATFPDGSQAYITHGHSIEPPLDVRVPMLNRRYLKQLGSSVDKIYKERFSSRWFRETNPVNHIFKNWKLDQMNKQLWLATGHSHYPELDLDRQFFNSGFVGSIYSSYVVASEDGLKLVLEKY